MNRPSGQDTVQVRRAYFRSRRRFGDLRFAAWAIPLALISWVFIAGFTGFGH